MKTRKMTIVLLIGLAAVCVWAATDWSHQAWWGIGSRRNTIEFQVYTPTIGSAAVLRPGTDDANDLGSSTRRFSEVHTMEQQWGVTAVVALSSNSTISPASSYVLIGSTGSNLTLGDAVNPSITTAGIETGRLLVLRSTGPTITLQDDATQGFSRISSSGTTVMISSRTAVMFIFDGTNWVHIQRAN
jgi:hypothetical protein